MIALVNPPGIKTFSGLQMHTPNPPLGLAYVAAALREAGFAYQVIDATGAALDAVSPYPGRSDFMMQGLTVDETVRRIPAEAEVIGVSCMFSTLWPLTHRVADAIPRHARLPVPVHVLLEPRHVDAALDRAQPRPARRRDGALRARVRRDELRLPGPDGHRQAPVDRGLLPRAHRARSRDHLADA